MSTGSLSASSLPRELWSIIVQMGTGSDTIEHVAYRSTTDGLFVFLSEQCYDWLEAQTKSGRSVITFGYSASEDVGEGMECIADETTSLTLKSLCVKNARDYGIHLRLCLGKALRGKKANLSTLLVGDIDTIEKSPGFCQIGRENVIQYLVCCCLAQIARDFQQSPHYHRVEWDFCLYGKNK